MRIQRYLAAECAVLALALAGTGLGIRAAAHLLSAQRTSGQAFAERAARATPSPSPRPFDPSPLLARDPETSEDTAGTFLGMEDDSLIARLRSQPIARMKFNRGGSSLSFRVDFADGSRAAFKPAQTNLQTIPRKEVAAYRLNRLLGIGAVAPATPRLLSRSEMFDHLHPETLAMLPRIRSETIFDPRGNTAGVMMFWIPTIKDSGLDTPAGIHQIAQWLGCGQLIPVDKHALAAQLSDMLLFDFLADNPDRYSGGNIMTNEDGSRLFFMDNTMAFFIEPEGNEKTRTALHRAQRFSRRLVRALDRISDESVARAMAQASEGEFEVLTKPEIRSVVARRDYVRHYIDGLIASYGSEEVLFFP